MEKGSLGRASRPAGGATEQAPGKDGQHSTATQKALPAPARAGEQGSEAWRRPAPRAGPADQPFGQGALSPSKAAGQRWQPGDCRQQLAGRPAADWLSPSRAVTGQDPATRPQRRGVRAARDGASRSGPGQQQLTSSQRPADSRHPGRRVANRAGLGETALAIQKAALSSSDQ